MDVAAVLQRSKPFCHAPEAAVKEVARTATTRELLREARLWDAGETPASFCTIYSGLFKVVRPLANGREAIVGLFGPRESIGDIAVMQGIAYPAAAIVCSETACVIQIPRAELLAQMERFPGLAISINQSMGDRVHALHAKVQILSAGGVEARLASLILELAERFGDEFDDDTVVIPIPLSRQDLANLISTTFETTIRVMSKWKKAGVMDTTSDGFVVRDMDHLRSAASSVLGR
jgi:CRP/FNR family transcriptional regulator